MLSVQVQFYSSKSHACESLLFYAACVTLLSASFAVNKRKLRFVRSTKIFLKLSSCIKTQFFGLLQDGLSIMMRLILHQWKLRLSTLYPKIVRKYFPFIVTRQVTSEMVMYALHDSINKYIYWKFLCTCWWMVKFIRLSETILPKKNVE